VSALSRDTTELSVVDPTIERMSSAVGRGLASVPTGPRLCALLAPVEIGAVPDEQLLEVLSAQWRQLAYQQAQVWATMAELASRNPMPNQAWTPDQVFDSAVSEVRAELRLTRRAASRELEHADTVAARPPVLQALQAGRIDRARAIVLAGGCLGLTDAQAERLLDEVLPGAGEVTASGLAERVRRVAIALDPAWAERRYRQALQDRRLITYLNDDGTATISAQHLPADQAAVACARVVRLADATKRAGAAASIDHLRTELFLGLLDGRFETMGEPQIIAELLRQFREPDRPATIADEIVATAAKDGVELRVGLATLLGLDDEPGEIAGLGPVPASVARGLAEQQRRCEWRFAIVDAEGRLLFDGVTRHRPGAGRSQPIRGGIVELHLPETLLDDHSLPARYPAWARVIADLAAQRAPAPIEQDPSARFPGRRLRRRVQVRHRTCLFPGCRRPATECDQDHREEHARGGPTAEHNLAPGCRHDHALKTTGGWRLIKKSDTTYLWISPLGRKHLTTIAPVAPPLPNPINQHVRRASDPDPPTP